MLNNTKMKNKKSNISIEMLIKLAIGVFVLLVLIYFIMSNLGKGSEETSDRITSSRDYDGDGILDLFDKCACHAGPQEDGGCDSAFPEGYSTAQKIECNNKRKGIST